MFQKLLRDERGYVDFANYLFIMTLLGIGMIVGLATLRDSIVQELGDLALGLETLNQNYTVNCTIGTQVKQFGFAGDTPADPDPAGAPPAGIDICDAPTGEGSGAGGGGGLGEG